MKPSTVIFLKTHGARRELEESIARIGFQGQGFEDPRAFLMRLKERAPMACVMDAAGEDAPVILVLLKSVRAALGPKFPLFAIVPGGDDRLQAKAMETGASALLRAPFRDDDLLELIAEHATREAGKAVELPKAIKWFFDTVSPALAGLGTAIDWSSEAEAQTRFCEERLAPYREPFIALVRAIRKTDAKLDLLQCVRMYGIRNTRNLIVAMRLSEVLGQPLVGFSAKTGGLVGDPKRALAYAIRTLDHFEEGSRNQVEAFNSGLVIDLLWHMAEGTGERKSAVRNFIEERYIEAIRHADQCIAVGKGVRKLALERHIVSASLMREAGRAAMAVLFPEYLERRRKLESRSIRPALQHLVELRYCSVSHNLLGALICQVAPALGEASKAVLFFEYPYLLSGVPTGVDALDLIQVFWGQIPPSQSV